METKKNPLSMQIDPALFDAATDDEKRQADVMSESTTFFKDGMRKLMKNPLAVRSRSRLWWCRTHTRRSLR